MSTPPVVDYTATSARPQWHELPAELRSACEVALGNEVVRAGRSVGSGFTGGFAAPLLLADGTEVFVKAAPEPLHAYGAYQREAELVPRLPAAIPAPAILATAHASTDGDEAVRWFAVAAERIDGRMPGNPWTAEDFGTATAMCEAMAAALTPSPLAGLESFAGGLGDDAQVFTGMLAGDLPVPAGFEPWLPERLAELADLVARCPVALVGDAAMHGDLRPDNLLIDTGGKAWTLDWNWLSLGPAWADWVGLLPVARHHGIDTAAAIRRSPLTADVPAEDLDCFVAIVAAYMMSDLDQPPMPGCTPEIRRHQRLFGWCFLAWLAERRGW